MMQNNVRVTHPNQKVSGRVQLTGSKSESNRALILQALAKGTVEVENLSAADDTVTLSRALQAVAKSDGRLQTVDIGPAGTAMRFLSSYLNLVEGKFRLTGSKRMQQRPIGLLVDALNELGARIQYADQEGFPPLLIQGGMIQETNRITIKGDISSQYISSLLLIAPALEKGLHIEIEGELTSRPYVTMTLSILKECGIDSRFEGNEISIEPQEFQQSTVVVEPDWSAASYWYAIVALSKDGNLVLPGLKPNSLQGDIAIVDIMKHFGVVSSFEPDGLHIRKAVSPSDQVLFDFKQCPDLAQTVVVVAAALKRDVAFTGLETLKIKETDRISALQTEIGKFGATLLEKETGVYYLDTKQVADPGDLCFDTYEDHRMAMAFAPLALVFDQIQIREPQVVEKSYPMFWAHLKAQGFNLQTD